MADYLKNNQSALRACILYEFVEGKPVFESYQNMCKKIGDDSINYKDFEYWFMRFVKGYFDLNYDRSLDQKHRLLSDMPVHIFEKIVKELDLEYRFVLRRVSKNFQYVIDGWYPEFKNISIQIGVDSAYLRFSCKTSDCKVTYGKRGTLIETEEHAKWAIEDLAIVLKNSKIQLDDFEVSGMYNTVIPEFKSMLKSLKRKKICVKKFTFIASLRDINGAIKVLSYLETEALEEVVLDIKSIPDHEKQLDADEWWTAIDQLPALVKLCKEAKMLTLMPYLSPDVLPIESFLQFRRFTIDFGWDHVTQTIALRFTKTLLKSTVLKHVILKGRINTYNFWNRFGRRTIEVPDRPNVRRLRIPKSKLFFEIEANYNFIRIERIS